VRLRLRSPRQLARQLTAAARHDDAEVADYLDSKPAHWTALATANPGDASDVLEQLSEDLAARLIGELEPDIAARVLEEIAPELAAELVEEVPIEVLTHAVEEMSTESAADLLEELDDFVSEAAFGLMDDAGENEIRQLMVYPTDSAGGLMTTEVASLPIGLSAGEAVERLRQHRDQYKDLSYVYVVDDANRLQGVISFRDLFFRRPGASLDEVMVSDPVTVRPTTDREEVAELCQRYHFLGLPVVDAAGRLIGIVNNDALLEAVQDEASEDFAASVGAGVEETVYTDVTESFRMRAPWLVLNLALALVVAFVIERQTGIISREPVLAALMPIIALLGGNGGIQSLAVTIRSLASDDVPGSQVPSILLRQSGIGLLNGLLLGVVSGLLTYLLLSTGIFASSDPLTVSIIVAAAAMANLFIAAIAGAGIPLTLRRMGQDPALASSIFLTLITDVVGFGGFLLLAAWLL